jgi:hypothetical protein
LMTDCSKAVQMSFDWSCAKSMIESSKTLTETRITFHHHIRRRSANLGGIIPDRGQRKQVIGVVAW